MAAEKNSEKRLAYTVNEALRLLPIGRTKFYDEANAGRLTLRKCGRTTLVLDEDLKAFLQSLPVVRPTGDESGQ